MARQRLSALPVRDLDVQSSSVAPMTGPASGGQVAEILPYYRLDLRTHGSDFHAFVSQVAELAKMLTGASGSAIAFRGEQGTICCARSGEGVPPLGAPVDLSSGISKQCLDSGASLRCEDITTDGRVDPEISQAIGVRAVAVVPICNDGEISGILEVVSSTPGIFTDQHLKRLQHLAGCVGSAAKALGDKPIIGSNVDAFQPDITLLVELEPAHRSFFRNFAELIRPRSEAPLAHSPSEPDVWLDVFVDSPLPWRRFVESVLLHVVVIGLFVGLSRIWPRELILSPPTIREAHITYYPPSPSFPARLSSPPKVQLKAQDRPAKDEVVRSGRERETVVASGARVFDDGQMNGVTMPPPAVPRVETGRFRKPELAAAVSPPPGMDQTAARQSRLPGLSVVAPAPDVNRGSGLRTSRAAGANIPVVPPPPSVNDRASLAHGAPGALSQTGVQVVAPPSSVPALTVRVARAGGISRGDGVSEVVPPPPSIAGAGNLVGGGRANSLTDVGSQVVPPAPSMQSGESNGGRGRVDSLGHTASQVVPPPPSIDGGGNTVGERRGSSLAGAGSQVVPPPPSMQSGDNGGGGRIGSHGQTASQVVAPPPSAPFGAGGNAGAGGRSGSLAGGRAEGVLPPVSGPGAGSSNSSNTSIAKDVPTSSMVKAGSDVRPIVQDVQLRVIALSWAPPRSSYFSNFEVFIAEKSFKKESQVIKLVYEFLPYQQRLSEYSLSDLKVQRLRVTRDSTCDESLMQMAWPEGENGTAGSHHSGDASALPSDRNSALPCYRTTADDYRRAVSRSR